MGTPMFTRIVHTTMAPMDMKLIMNIKRGLLMLDMGILDIIVMDFLVLVTSHMDLTSAKLSQSMDTQVLATIIEVHKEFKDMDIIRGLLSLDMVISDIIVMVFLVMVTSHMDLTSVRLNLAMDILV